MDCLVEKPFKSQNDGFVNLNGNYSQNKTKDPPLKGHEQAARK